MGEIGDAGRGETREALAAGLALARRAAREAAAPLLLSAGGWTAVFVAEQAALPPAAGAALAWTGLALVLLMAPSKLSALHRLAAGDEACDPLVDGGLQWTALEARLAATAVALAAAAAILFATLGATAAALLIALRPLGRVEAGPIGPLGVGFVLLSPALLAAVVGSAWAMGRLSVTLAADAAEARPRFARGWLLTRGAGLAPAAVWLLTCALPLAGLLAVQGGLDALGQGLGRWSVGEALVTGGVLAAATQLLFAPLNAGALAQLRRAGLARKAARAVDTFAALGDKAAAPPPEPLPA